MTPPFRFSLWRSTSMETWLLVLRGTATLRSREGERGLEEGDVLSGEG
jgi:uncharacterized cupin superfamily protein